MTADLPRNGYRAGAGFGRATNGDRPQGDEEAQSASHGYREQRKRNSTHFFSSSITKACKPVDDSTIRGVSK
jgi:hypothetical protein